MASVSSGQRDAYGEERRNSDISLGDVQAVLPTYEESTDPNLNKENPQPAPLLSARVAILLYLAIYTAVAITGWALVCQAASKPTYRIPYVFGSGALRAAKVLTSIAGLLTIPMTSAACAYAAVNYIQFSPRRRNYLTLRQSLALANNGWADPKILLSLLSAWHARKQGSLLLWFAILVNIIGFIVYPLQQLLVGLETVTVPQDGKTIRVADIQALYNEEALASPDTGEISTTLRSTLSSTHYDDPQSHLWQSQVANCRDENSEDFSWCTDFQGAKRSLSLYDYPEFRDPFVAPLRYGFSTGTERQFAPRFNSSVTYVKVTDDEFAEKCSDADYFKAEYHFSDSTYGSCDLKACMPGDLTFSPFKNQRAPQHIEEVLYLNVSTYDYGQALRPTAYKAVMRTTLGFFELPNYMNGEVCGPLLDTDPTAQSVDYDGSQFTDMAGADDDFEVSNERPYGLASVPGKGPLAEIAVALFGNGSFLDIRNKPDYTEVFQQGDGIPPLCSLPAPMTNLVSGLNSRCSRATDLVQDASGFIYMFGNSEDMAQQLTSAAVLANDLHLSVIPPVAGVPPLLPITHDEGVAFQRPSMSRSAMIVITVLLAIYLGSIYILAFYASFQSSWAEKLDAFAMLRMGSALSDRGDLFAVTSRFRTREEALDKLPGYIGDVKPEEEVGQLGVGAHGPLVRKRKYRISNNLMLGPRESG